MKRARTAAFLGGFLLWGVARVAAPALAAAASTATVAAAIDPARSLGPLAGPFGAGWWFQRLPPAATGYFDDGYIYDKVFADNFTDNVQLSIDQLGSSSSLADYLERLRRSYPSGSAFVQNLKKSGALVAVTFVSRGLMPRWLSSRPGDMRNYIDSATDYGSIEGTSPPRCYEWSCPDAGAVLPGWEQVAYETARFFQQELGLANLALLLGHEPNRDWLGKESDYYARLYRHMVLGARKVSTNIKLGGVGSWAYYAPKLACDFKDYVPEVQAMCFQEGGWADPEKEPMTKNLIDYAAENGLPLDIVNYHSFATRPGNFQRHGSEIRSWLEVYPAKGDFQPAAAEIFPADWTRWGGAYYADYLDTEEPAAYAAAALPRMSSGTIRLHGHDFDVINYVPDEMRLWAKPYTRQFYGGWSVFTPGQVVKPAYNAFAAISRFAGKVDGARPERVEASLPEDDFVTGAAAVAPDKKTMRVLLSNFVPTGEMRRGYVLAMLRPSAGDALAPYEACMEENKERSACIALLPPLLKPFVDCVLKGETKACVPLLPAETQAALSAAIETLDYAGKNPRQVSLSLVNLRPASPYKVTGYRIDSERSNSCRYNYRTAPDKTGPCGFGGAVDQEVQAAWAQGEAARGQAQADALKRLSRYRYDLYEGATSGLAQGTSFVEGRTGKGIRVDQDDVLVYTLGSAGLKGGSP